MTAPEVVVSVSVILAVTIFTFAIRRRSQGRNHQELQSKPSLVGALNADRPIFGRSDDIGMVGRSEDSLVVIYGDPGIGKSEVLLRAREVPGVLSPPPVQLAHHSGALQTSLLEALGAAVAERIDASTTASRVGALLADAVTRVADQRSRDLAAAALGVVSGIVKDRLGNTLGGLVDDTVAQVRTSASEQLGSRIATSSNPDVVKAFVMLASEAAKFAECPIILSLDAGERLSDEDLRIAYDLVEALPEHVRVRIAIATLSGREVEMVSELRARGALGVQLKPLTSEDVAQWLQGEAVEAGHIAKIMDVSAGYPLYVDSAIGHLQAGLPLHDLPMKQSFVAQTEQLFRRLDADCRRATLFLSAFTDPPPLAYALASTGLDEANWLLLETRLQDERIFVTNVDGHPWFHELRRRALWSEVFTDEQRAISAKSALARILEQADDDRRLTIAACMDLARLSVESEEFIEEHPNLREALGLSQPALAFLGAVIELSEPGGTSEAVDAEAAIRHAREAFGTADDLVPIVRELADGPLLVLVENDQAAAVVLTWGSAVAQFAVVGRLGFLTNRTPIPRLATATFNVEVSPRLGGFETANYGVGHPDVIAMSKTLKDMLVERDGNHVTFLPEKPGALVRMKVGETDLYAGVIFADEEQRDAAVVALSGFNDPHFFGQRFTVSDVVEWPQPVPLPSMRFVNAGDLVTGLKFGGLHGNTGGYVNPEVTDLEQETEIRRRLYAVIRELASPLERLVLDLDRERGYLYGSDDRGALIADVANGDSVVEIDVDDELHPFFGPRGPFASLRMEQAAGLSANQRVTHTVFRSAGSAQDPVPEVIKSVEARIRAFNTAQRTGLRLQLRLDEEEIANALQAAQDRRSSDAEAFVNAGVFTSRPALTLHEDLYVAINPGREREGWVTGAEGHLFYVRAPASGSRNSVRVRVLGDDDEVVRTPEELGVALGLNKGTLSPDRYTSSDLISGLAGLLGYAWDAVRLIR